MRLEPAHLWADDINNFRMQILNSKILTVLLLVLSAWMLFSVISVELEKGAVQREETNITAKINNVKQSNELLEKYIKKFRDPEFLEKEVRLRLNYKVAGEEVVFVYRDSNLGIASPSKEFFLNKLTNYKKWWRSLLKIKN